MFFIIMKKVFVNENTKFGKKNVETHEKMIHSHRKYFSNQATQNFHLHKLRNIN